MATKKEVIISPYLDIITGGDIKKIQAVFSASKLKFNTPTSALSTLMPATKDQKTGTEFQAEAMSQYKSAFHDIFDQTTRPQKNISKDTGEVDSHGDPVLASSLVEVARIAMPFQKIIVNRRVGFMLSEPVKTEAVRTKNGNPTAEDDLIALVDRIQNDNKMDYKNKEIARRMMSELEVAEVWYFVHNDNPDIKGEWTLRMKILSPELGDILLPLFDNFGTMIAFARDYKIRDENNQDIQHYDVYTSEFEYKYVTVNKEMVLDPTVSPNPIPNTVGKLMVNYYTQPEPEWTDVQSMISRLETLISNHADTNDYFGNPILAVSGLVSGYADKGQTGKILQLEQGANANYLALSSEPASVAMEIANLEKFIYAMSQTPNITFEEMKSIGAVAGIAIKLMFLDAHMAVKMKEELFGMGLQRRLNIIKEAIGKVIDTGMAKVASTVQLKPVLTPYLPVNDQEQIANLVTAVTGGILSKETAVENNPYVPDSKEEMARLSKDNTQELAQGQPTPQNMNQNNLNKINPKNLQK